MVGGVSVLNTIVDEPLLSRSNITEARLYRNGVAVGRWWQYNKKSRLAMGHIWQEWRMSARVFRAFANIPSRKHQMFYSHFPSLVVVDEIAGQYEDSFEDVGKHLLDCFTFKAVRTVLNQLYEMNPSQYKWFYNFVATNKPNDGKRFLRHLVKERQELAERVMITRLHLFNKWVKSYSHVNMHQAITDENLELMRERLVETVRWPSDGDGESAKNG